MMGTSWFGNPRGVELGIPPVVLHHQGAPAQSEAIGLPGGQLIKQGAGHSGLGVSKLTPRSPHSAQGHDQGPLTPDFGTAHRGAQISQERVSRPQLSPLKGLERGCSRHHRHTAWGVFPPAPQTQGHRGEEQVERGVGLAYPKLVPRVPPASPLTMLMASTESRCATAHTPKARTVKLAQA